MAERQSPTPDDLKPKQQEPMNEAGQKMVQKPGAQKRETVIVEAMKRGGFPGFYALGRLFPGGQPVELEVTTEDIYKTKKVLDPVTDETTEERYLYRESELKQLLNHSAFLKIYRNSQTPIGADQPVKADSKDHHEAGAKAIKIANEEASGEQNDRGPTGTKR